ASPDRPAAIAAPAPETSKPAPATQARGAAFPIPVDAGFVTVLEVAGPKDSLVTAQPLPDVPREAVMGTMAPADKIDLYRLAIDAKTDALRLNVGMVPGGGGDPNEYGGGVWLFDAGGQVIGHWHMMPRDEFLRVLVDGVKVSRSSTLYVGISPE